MHTLATDPVLDTMLRRFGNAFGDPRTPFKTSPAVASMPLDVTRHDDHIVLTFELPGIDPRDIEVTVDGRELVVHAERDVSVPEGATRVRSERYQGVFERRVQLGETLDLDVLTADHYHGVLEIVIPIAAAAQPRKVAVGSATAAPPEVKS
jgi:HSP20 family protein